MIEGKDLANCCTALITRGTAGIGFHLVTDHTLQSRVLDLGRSLVEAFA